MMSRFKKLGCAPMVLAAFLAFSVQTGCKQGEGEVCQIDDDCESPLQCNTATRRCQQPGAGIVDAGTDAPTAIDSGVDGDADVGDDAG